MSFNLGELGNGAKVAHTDNDGAKPFDLVNPHAAASVLVICDHASRAVPADLNGLGLDPEILDQHVAWDIGAGKVASGLAYRLGVPAVLCGFSRLVIDPNRALDHAQSIREESDGIPIPGNRDIDGAEAARRAEALYLPYHREIEQRLRAIAEQQVPVLVAIHSFTPQLNGEPPRPWHGALLHGDDDRFIAPVHDQFRALYPDLVIGDNEPYTGYPHHSNTVPHQAESHGYPNVTFEIRQDLIEDQDGILSWADRLAKVLREPLGDPALRRLWEGA